MEAKTKDLWVFVETKADGSAKNVGLELLNPGRRLADKQGGALAAVIIGNHVDEAVKAAAAHDADKVIVVEGDEYENYSTDAYANAMYHLVEKYGPTTLMIGATPNGRDFGPRVSCRLKTGLTADCTSLDIDEESGDIARLRRALGGADRLRRIAGAVGHAQVGRDGRDAHKTVDHAQKPLYRGFLSHLMVAQAGQEVKPQARLARI